MGWLFGYYERRTLIEHLVNGNGVKTLKHFLSGNNLWCVHEHDGQRWACLYLLRGSPKVKNDPYNWGYKDVCESMGPNEISFPYTWLGLLTPIASEYANAWRARVKERGEKSRRMAIGSKWKGYGHAFEIRERRGPSSFLVVDETGMSWRVTTRQLLTTEEIQ